MTSPLELWDEILASITLWLGTAGALCEGSSGFLEDKRLQHLCSHLGTGQYQGSELASFYRRRFGAFDI